jgi:uncharacterized protein
MPLTPAQYALALLAALCVGLAKSGFSGVSLVSVVVFADLYGAKTSIGFVLPLLITADLMAWPAFRKHGSWKAVWPMLWPALVGLGIGWWVLGILDDQMARKVIGASIWLMVFIQASRRLQPETFDRLAQSRGFGTVAGVTGGFSTMLNAAGPVIQLYLMARKIPKMELIGTGARFFLLINLIKVPLNSKLALITPLSLLENAKLVPAVAIGVYGGRHLMKHVPQKAFEWMIIGFSMIAGIRLTLF